MVVGRTSFRNFRVGKSLNSFIVLDVYMEIEVEELFGFNNVLLRRLVHFIWC